ncbi:MAG: T9SS type A sorting domain-containing protein [Chitinophagaceae bacterium]|nr:T9SS type A sorting domain-containing protein [Chitinophagaceae bacterium]
MKKIISSVVLVCYITLGAAQLTIQNGATFYLDNGSIVSVEKSIYSVEEIYGEGDLVITGTTPTAAEVEAPSIPGLIVYSNIPAMLKSNLYIKKRLTLSGAGIQLNQYNLALDKSAAFSGNDRAYIITNGSGTLKISLNANKNTGRLDIGTSRYYMPLNFKYAGESTNGYVEVQAVEKINPRKNAASGHFLNSYWNVHKYNLGGELTARAQIVSPGIVHGNITRLRSSYWDGREWQFQENNSSDPNNANVIASISSANGEIYAMSDATKKVLSILDNPFRSSAILQWSSEDEELYNIVIVDLDGKVLQTMSQKIPRGVFQKKISFDNYPPGMYMIKVESKSVHETIKAAKL